VDKIKHLAPSDPDKVSKIISILRKKTDDDFVKFCNILDKSGNQHWIASLRGLCKLYDDRLVEVEAEMRTRLSLEGLIPLLERPAGGFMTPDERIAVTNTSTDPEKVSKIISILRKKTDGSTGHTYSSHPGHSCDSTYCSRLEQSC
jgi:hypothetical protein